MNLHHGVKEKYALCRCAAAMVLTGCYREMYIRTGALPIVHLLLL
jgi:hypothetical protein